jgi:phytoene dehydrogenase-like protein
VSNRAVIVVGAAHNGLVAASYLAKAGRKVHVLEKRDALGGATVTEEIFPGFRICTVAAGGLSTSRNSLAERVR